ncbi:PLC-like phosphodiesterase [Xylariaceae sp. FL0255]|nr:PLC-like phosphodiesterase [Xylariaceae sp. FL0255]
MESVVPAWAAARSVKGNRFPQAIGHRGYSASFPENTMAAFRGAKIVGAHALETDVRLSADGSMPRLVDLLQYLVELAVERAWLLLDIKKEASPKDLLAAIARAIASVPCTKRPWNERIILGPWDTECVGACLRLLPGFPVALIAFSPDYASAMLSVPNLNFNVFSRTFATARGNRFVKEAKKLQRLTFSWTDNEDEWMAFSIQNGIDGVITDDPKRFLEVCEQWTSDDVRKAASGFRVKQLILYFIINILIRLAETVAWLKDGSPEFRVKRAVEK